MRTPILLLSLFSLLLPGCSHLIVRDDDNAAVATAKVTSRIIIGLPTLGMSEMGIDAFKKEEAVVAQESQCRENGLVPVRSGALMSAQFHGCFTQSGYEQLMIAQAANRPNTAAAFMMLQAMNPPVQPRREPLPIPNLQRPVALNCSGLNNGGISTTTCY